jgi:MauM/NapG family ferredoxin protein
MEVDRRGFFRAGFEEMMRAVGEGLSHLHNPVEESQACPEPTILRPPGAVTEAEFLELCTGCNDCIMACPKQAIRKAGDEFGETQSGKPMIIAETNPCWLCKDLPCITACETGALEPVESPASVRMGLASIDLQSCYAAQGSICESCLEACPVRPKAITLRYGSPPEVVLDKCTGCGVCAYLCPADAIGIEPN